MKRLRPFRSVLYILLSLLLSIGCSDDGARHDVDSIPDPKKTDGGYVSNPDQILSESIVQQVNALLVSLDQSGTAQVAVVVVNSIGDNVPKDFAVELFNSWKIGTQEKDNGLLILMVKDQRRVEFETGYGLEGDLPDVTCFRIQQDYMVPYFKSEDYDNGILQGVTAVVNQLSKQSSSAPEVTDVPENTEPETPYVDYIQVTWTDHEFSITKREKVSFAKAWQDIRQVYRQVDFPPMPDTAYSTVEQTDEGYLYTIRIPADFTGANVMEVILNSSGSIFVYGIVLAILFFMSFSRDRRDYNTAEKRVHLELFSNTLMKNNGFIMSFLIVGFLSMLAAYLYVYKSVDAPWYYSVFAGYLTLCAYLHLHFMVLLPVRAASLRAVEQHEKYEALSEAYRYVRVFGYIFPLPFLFLFSRWHRIRMRSMRDALQTCDCGAKMVKLDERADDQYLSEGDQKEELLLSVDYDVWVCRSCQKQRVFRYENFLSSAMPCTECSKKTVRMTNREVVQEATESSSGYGYKHYLCSNCNATKKVKFTIAKESSSSGGSSGSSSSGGSSWGGGSSGGGGSGSSW